MDRIAAMTPFVRGLQTYMGRFDRVTARRGRSYCYGGQVRDVGLSKNENELQAVVLGGAQYSVRLLRGAVDWSGVCSCPVGSFCKHLYAVALMASQSPPVPGSLDDGKKPEAPKPAQAKPAVPSAAEVPRGAAVAAPGPASAAVGPRSEKDVPQGDPTLHERLGKALGRPLDRNEMRYVMTIQNAHRYAIRNGHLSAWELGGLVRDTMRYGWEMIRPWPGRAPESEYKFWLYLSYFLENRGEKIPDFLRSISDFSLVESEIRVQERELAIERWKTTLQGVRLRSTLSSEPVRLRLVFDGTKASLEEWNEKKEAYQALRSARLADLRAADPSVTA